MTLLYPQWVPGAHAPGSSITLLAGLKFSGAGKRIVWKRDPLNMHAFHVEVPSGVDSLDAEFQYLSPLQSSQGRMVVTADMLGLQWHTVVLYPAGFRTDSRLLPVSTEPTRSQERALTMGARLLRRSYDVRGLAAFRRSLIRPGSPAM